jgi:hypothetical protein
LRSLLKREVQTAVTINPVGSFLMMNGAGTADPDQNRATSWCSTDGVAQGAIEQHGHGIDGELWPTKGKHKGIRFSFPMEGVFIRRLTGVASDSAVSPMRGEVV